MGITALVLCLLGSLVPPVTLPLSLAALVLGIILIVRRRFAIGIVATVLALVLPWIVLGLAWRSYRVPSESMLPTLSVGDRVLVAKFEGPSVGSIVVFHPPVGATTGAPQCGAPQGTGQVCGRPTPQEATSVNFIKRVVAGPGDRVAVENGHVILNGNRQAESFIRPCGTGENCNFPTPVTVPPGYWFVMGDNRGASDDSRFTGPIPRSWVIGRVFLRWSPLDKLGAP